MMRVNKNIFYYLSCLILFSFTQCNKNSLFKSDNAFGLPNASENGSRVFACRLDGQNRIAIGDIIAQNALVSADSVSVFAAFAAQGYTERIKIAIYGTVQINHAYKVDDTLHCKFLFSSDSTCQGHSTRFTTVFSAYGSIVFTRIDSIAKIVSGTFDFKVPMPDCDTLSFTYGRFDVLY
jgi:hypothetical protein